jgi:hypothetical protein
MPDKGETTSSVLLLEIKMPAKGIGLCSLFIFVSKVSVLLLFAGLTKNENRAFTEQTPILRPNAESTAQLLQWLALMMLDSFCWSIHWVTRRKEP